MSDKKYDEDDIQRLGGVIAENIVNQFKAGFEAIEEIKNQVAKIPEMQEDIHSLKLDMQVVKTAVKDTNRDVHKLEVRVTRLETGA